MSDSQDANAIPLKSILIVDDEVEILAMLRELLDAQYRTCCAKSGEDALAAMMLSMPDLVIMDVSMPGIGGIEALKAIRSDPLLSPVPVIMMSGVYPYMNEKGALWNAYLEKPFSPDQLAKLIATHLLN